MDFFNCKEEEFYQKAKNEKNGYLCRIIPATHMHNSLYSGDLEASAKWYDIREENLTSDRNLGRSFTGGIVLQFLTGVIALHFAREGSLGRNKEEWSAIGKTAISRHRRLAKGASSWNFDNKLLLLEAEQCFLMDNEEMALEKYDAAITAAKDHRFVHEEGLTNERAARFHMHYGRTREALVHYTQAKTCYERWGALAPVRYLESKISSLGESAP